MGQLCDFEMLPLLLRTLERCSGIEDHYFVPLFYFSTLRWTGQDCWPLLSQLYCAFVMCAECSFALCTWKTHGCPCKYGVMKAACVAVKYQCTSLHYCCHHRSWNDLSQGQQYSLVQLKRLSSTCCWWQSWWCFSFLIWEKLNPFLSKEELLEYWFIWHISSVWWSIPQGSGPETSMALPEKVDMRLLFCSQTF